MRDMAEELLKLYAARKAVPGHAFSPDSHWQQEFEDAFEWDLTPDQADRDRRHQGRHGIADADGSPALRRRRLRQDRSRDARGVQGGDGRQAGRGPRADDRARVPAPEDAEEPLRGVSGAHRHGQPLPHEGRAEGDARGLAAGKVEIIVGTHRLLSKDVQFRDLGLLVVDEEQRFGVAHKERIKQMRKRVDVLTMTATPIPRTLNMSLAGIRDMSIIETPPRDRLSIQTNVVKFDQAVIARAIRTEMERGGQIYFVHNRVESIYSLGNLITRLVPEARIGVGHGQMSEDELERVMVDFVAHKYDVLLATTIIENGLDIPNANTIIINRADRYGLSQLYQLRGRVGRSDRRAYAYLLIPPEEALSPVAKKRLAAIREFSDLGSGFRVAALDLEIRGAGNLLGGEQSGHIEAVGFDMYMKLLEQTIKELKGEEIEDEVRANVNLRVDLRIDESYIPDMNQRLTVYRRMAAVRTDAGAGPADGRGPRPIRRCRRIGAQSGRICVDPAHGRPDRARVDRPRRPDRRPKVQARRQARPGRGCSGRPGARRRDAGAAGDAEAGLAARRPAAGAGAGRPAGGRRPALGEDKGERSGGGRLLVGGPGQGRRGRPRVHPGRDHAAGEGRSARRRAACSPGCAGCCAS